MYMAELTITLRDPKTDFPLATGNSLHTSLPRLSTTEMLNEVVENISRGGTETGALDTTNISDADLKGAIEDSIARNNLFRTVIQGKGADYELTVRVAGLSKPVIGTSLQVELETGWTLVRTSDRAVLLRKPIKSSATKTMGDAFVTRLRMAIEAATQDNIAQGLKAIAELKLE